jgi:hypothetical protein
MAPENQMKRHLLLLALILLSPSYVAGVTIEWDGSTIVEFKTRSVGRGRTYVDLDKIRPNREHLWAWPRTSMSGFKIGEVGSGVSAEEFDTTTKVEITVETSSEAPWGDSFFKEDYDVWLKTFPVRVWRYRGSTLCAVQLFEVPAIPGVQRTYSLDLTNFRVGDTIMFEHRPAYVLTHNWYDFTKSSEPFMWYRISSGKDAAFPLPPRTVWPSPPFLSCN